MLVSKPCWLILDNITLIQGCSDPLTCMSSNENNKNQNWNVLSPLNKYEYWINRTESVKKWNWTRMFFLMTSCCEWCHLSSGHVNCRSDDLNRLIWDVLIQANYCFFKVLCFGFIDFYPRSSITCMKLNVFFMHFG